MVATASSAGRVLRQIHGSQVAIEMGWAFQVQHVLVRSAFLSTLSRRSRLWSFVSWFFLYPGTGWWSEELDSAVLFVFSDSYFEDPHFLLPLREVCETDSYVLFASGLTTGECFYWRSF